MKREAVIATTCIVGGLVGLGVLAYVWYREEEEDKTAALPSSALRLTVPKKPGGRAVVSKEKPLAKGQKKDSKTPKARLEKPEDGFPTTRPGSTKTERTEEEGQTQVRPAPEGDAFPLRLGSQGKRVERLQVWLMRNYGWFGTVTDTYDDRITALVHKHLGTDKVDEATYHKYKMGHHVTEQLMIH